MPAASSLALSRVSPTVGIRDQYGNLVGISSDQFGRLRVSGPQSLFAHKQVDLAPEFLVSATALDAGSTGVYDRNTSSTILESTVAGNKAVYQTVRRFNYEAGKSQLVFITGQLAPGNLSGGAKTAAMRMGQFDSESGAYWEASNEGDAWNQRIVLRSSTGYGLAVEQADWNIDRLNGTRRPYNPSGYTLHPDACNIFCLSFEWLGVGGVLASYVIGNTLVPAHFFEHANLVTDVYWRTPNLPLRWECESYGAAVPSATMKAICGAVISEGGAENAGILRSDYITTAVTAATGTIRELLSMRLRSNGTADGVPALSSATVFAADASITNTTNDAGILAIGYNPTFTGAGTWGDPIGTGGSSSHVQICKSGRVVTNPGHVIHSSSYSSLTRSNESAFDRTSGIGCRPITGSGYGVSDIISLMYINPTAGNVSCIGTLGWREVI